MVKSKARTGNGSLPTMGKSQPNKEESYGPGRNKKPRRRAEEVKSSAARIPRSLDKVGPPQEEVNMG